jgi:ketosteroid isomerase-like protein
MPEPDTTEPAEFVRRYLRLVEARDLDNARAFLAPDVRITFPGGRVFNSLTDQVASSGTRFRSVHKTFDHFDSLIDGDRTVVYVFGDLDGVSLNGTPFESVRFIDRFVLSDGHIIDHMVWNDLAERGIVSED